MRSWKRLFVLIAVSVVLSATSNSQTDSRPQWEYAFLYNNTDLTGGPPEWTFSSGRHDFQAKTLQEVWQHAHEAKLIESPASGGKTFPLFFEAMGASGWELFHVMNAGGADFNFRTYFFKRRRLP